MQRAKPRRFPLTLLLLVFPLVFFVPNVTALTNYEETFEDDTVGQNPTDDWYTFGTVRSISTTVTSTAPTLGAKSFRFTAPAAAGTDRHYAEFTSTATAGWNLCAAGSLSFAFNVDTIPAAGSEFLFGIKDANDEILADRMVISIPNGGIPVASVVDSGSAGTASFVGAVSADTWYNVTVSNIDCANGEATFSIAELEENVRPNCACAITNTHRLYFGAAGPAAGKTARIDNITLNSVSDPIGATVVGVSAPFTNLVGFDVDAAGNTLVVRTDGGDFVRVRDANSLTGGGNQETDCVASDAVAAEYFGDLIAFKQCMAPAEVWIRTRAMTVPTDEDFNGCPVGAPCPDEISLSQFADEGGDNLGEMHQLRAFPFNYSSRDDTGLVGIPDFHTGWAFSGTAADTSPRIGFALFTAEGGPTDDEWRTRSVQYPNSGLAMDMCVGLDAGGYYIAAVDDADSGRSWPVAFDSEDVADVSFGTPAIYSGALSNSYGVACGEDRIGLHPSTAVYVVDRSSGAFVQTWTTATTTEPRSIALSDKFPHPTYGGIVQFAAFLDDATIKVGFVGNATIACNMAKPTGTWVGMLMDRTAQTIWVATSTQVVRFPITTCTTIVPVSSQGSQPPAPGITTGLSGAGDAFVPFGVSRFGGNLIWAVAVIGGISISSGMSIAGLGSTMGVRTKDSLFEFAKWGLMIGAVLGFFVAWGFQLLNTATVAGIVILAALGVGLKYYASRIRD